MVWLRWHLEGNIIAIVLAMLVAVAVASMAIFGIPVRSGTPDGFGPDWECTDHPRGGPTCIKKLKP